MPFAPVDYNICPCCGTEFGLDDVEMTHAELRDQWLRQGAVWFSDELRCPQAIWNPFVQLTLADLEYDHSYEGDWVKNQVEAQSVNLLRIA